MWPRAFSTFGLLNKLNKDILEADFSSFGTLGTGETARRIDEALPVIEEARDSGGARLVVERPNRHRDEEVVSCRVLRAPLAGFDLGADVLYVAT